VDHLYGSVAELRAEIEDERADPHRKAAAVLFGLPDDEVHPTERRWGKYLNMAAVTGLSLAGLADLAQVPLDKAREMRERYRRLVLA
jgi:DNA polymerase I-like protein with 3'-5' exonuclease and polymerase domains